MPPDKPLRMDKLHGTTAAELKEGAHLALGHLQKRGPRTIVSALASTFLLVCRRYGVEVRAVLEVVERQLRDAKDVHPVEMRALIRFLKEDLPDV